MPARRLRPGASRRDLATLREMVAWACRILTLDGQGDLTLGHVSARAPDGRLICMKRKGLGLDEVTPADVLILDLDGRKVAGQGEVHLEAPLHTEVYKARPDVGAVIHTHPPYGTAFGAVEGGLQFLSHDALLFPEGVGFFEETADLVTSQQLGQAVARALDRRRALVLRNHGVLVVGPDLRWAVLAAVTLERALRLQAIAAMLGPVKPIPAAAAAPLHESKYRDEFLGEYWAYWIRRLRRLGLDQGMPRRRAARS